MSYLFTIENKTKVMPKPEVLLIEPFKSIWDRDDSSNKEAALQEFAYIELMTSKSKANPFKNLDDDSKHEQIKKAVIKKKSWKPDAYVKKAMEMLLQFQYDMSPTYKYYADALIAANNTRSFLKDIDLGALSPKGFLLYKPTDVVNAIIKTDVVIEKLKKLEQQVHEEIEEASSIRGNKMITYFNNPDNFK